MHIFICLIQQQVLVPELFKNAAVKKSKDIIMGVLNVLKGPALFPQIQENIVDRVLYCFRA